MKRRQFLISMGASLILSCEVLGQQRARNPLIGFIGSDTAAAQRRWTEAFVHRLRELGWVEGSTVAIEYRWAEGRPARAAEAAAEFVGLGVDLIVTNGTTMILAAKRATATIPIVFPVAGDRERLAALALVS